MGVKVRPLIFRSAYIDLLHPPIGVDANGSEILDDHARVS